MTYPIRRIDVKRLVLATFRVVGVPDSEFASVQVETPVPFPVADHIAHLLPKKDAIVSQACPLSSTHIGICTFAFSST